MTSPSDDPCVFLQRCSRHFRHLSELSLVKETLSYVVYASPLHLGVEVWLPREKAAEGNDLMHQVQVMQIL